MKRRTWAEEEVREVHDWYMAQQDRTYEDVGVRYGVTRQRVQQVFKHYGLSAKKLTAEQTAEREQQRRRRDRQKRMPRDRLVRAEFQRRLRQRGLKACARCSYILPRAEYPSNGQGRPAGVCKPCNSERAGDWAKANPDAVARHNNQRRTLTTLIDPESHDAWVAVLRGDPCAYCGRQATIHIDHIEPLARGGSAEWDNLTAACPTCNLTKRAHPLLIFLQRVVA